MCSISSVKSKALVLVSALTVNVGREEMSSKGDIIGGGEGGIMPTIGADLDGEIVSGGKGGRDVGEWDRDLSLWEQEVTNEFEFDLSFCFCLLFFDIRKLIGVTGGVFSGGGTIRDRLSRPVDSSLEKCFWSRGSFLSRESIL